MSKRHYIRALYAACVMALSSQSFAACNLVGTALGSNADSYHLKSFLYTHSGFELPVYEVYSCDNMPEDAEDFCDPDVYTPETKECGPAPEPECGVDDGKSPEQCSCEEQGKQFFPIGGCGLPDDEDDQTNDRDECESGGGTYGSVNGQNVCLDEDYGAPNCSSGGNIASYEDSEGGSGWACEPDQSGNSDETDTDNDGLPDSQDTDIDNDGIPNSFDDDADGDGTPNNSDADYRGERPDQSGLEGRLDKLIDLQQNNNDKQKELFDEASDNFIDQTKTQLDSAGFDPVSEAFDGVLDQSLLNEGFEGNELSSLENDMNGLFPDLACSDLRFSVPNSGQDFAITCSDTQEMRSIFAWFLYATTAWFLFSLATTPPQRAS